MYKSAQDKQDWLGVTGTHATRPKLHANITPFAQFERGALPEMKDEESRITQRLPSLSGRPFQEAVARRHFLRGEIKRLNREAAETTERALLYQAMRNVLSEELFKTVGKEARRLRMLATGEDTMP